MNRHLRTAGLAALLLGLFVVAVWFPTTPAESWEFIHAFEFGTEECRTLLESRETTVFVCPESIEETVTAAEVARRYNLELALVCQANGMDPNCGGHRIAPGESLILPLGRRARDVRPPSSPPGSGG